MRQGTAALSLPHITLDTTAARPLYRQIYDALAGAILGGQLAPGTRLPATRALAAELGVARNTVINAYDQLVAEGYLVSGIGSGTVVARDLPDDPPRPPAEVALPAPGGSAARALSRRGALMAAATASVRLASGAPRPFRTGSGAFDAFPFDVWGRIVARVNQSPPRAALGYGDPAGYRPLREAVAAYLCAARALRCDAEQVIVVAGAQQGIDLVARVLLDPGDPVWMEDPAYPGAHGALVGAGARIVPVPLDDEGLDLAAAEVAEPRARMAYVTPSRHFPLGVTMSLRRRLDLLDWASRAGAWIVEDDYDSEYRYMGRPLAAMQGLDRDGRVLYLGTLSKVLFPALRLGYLVVPSDLVAPLRSALALMCRYTPVIPQIALTHFITEGHFSRHIRRMRALYATRQAALVAAARASLAGLLDVPPAAAGMHLVGWLPQGSDDRAVSRDLLAAGVEASPLSAFCLAATPPPALVLGYAGYGEEKMGAAVRRMATVLG